MDVMPVSNVTFQFVFSVGSSPTWIVARGFGLLPDTGAAENLVGANYVKAFEAALLLPFGECARV